MPRLYSHGLVLAIAAIVPVRMVMAGAAPTAPPRITLHSEATAYLAADPAPPRIETLPPAPAVVDESIPGIIRAAAAKYGANPDQLLRVARCESHQNPRDYNPRTGASGLFQFLPRTFRAHGGTDIWDPHQQADIAAKMFASGWSYQWSCH